jgi:hypothetical protein
MCTKLTVPYQPLLMHACVQGLTLDRMPDFTKETERQAGMRQLNKAHFYALKENV